MKVTVSALGPTPLEAVYEYSNMEQPVPGPDEVVVAVRSAQVGWVDLLMATGGYQHKPDVPYTPGLEAAGEIVAAGPGASWKVGDRVLTDGAVVGPRAKGPYQKNGGFASFVLAPARGVIRIPGALSFDQACNLLGNYETAYHCLIARGQLKAGETVLVLGATGATGMAAVQVARAMGATAIAAGRSEKKLSVVNADHAVTSDGLRDKVKALTGGKGVDVVYDAVGGELSQEALRCTTFGARFVIVGWASTPFVGSTTPNMLPTNYIMMKGLSVLGAPMMIATGVDPSIRVPRLKQVLAWAEEGKISPHVSRTFPLADFKEALAAKWRGEIVGGCVLQP